MPISALQQCIAELRQGLADQHSLPPEQLVEAPFARDQAQLHALTTRSKGKAVGLVGCGARSSCRGGLMFAGRSLRRAPRVTIAAAVFAGPCGSSGTTAPPPARPGG